MKWTTVFLRIMGEGSPTRTFGSIPRPQKRMATKWILKATPKKSVRRFRGGAFAKFFVEDLAEKVSRTKNLQMPRLGYASISSVWSVPRHMRPSLRAVDRLGLIRAEVDPGVVVAVCGIALVNAVVKDCLALILVANGDTDNPVGEPRPVLPIIEPGRAGRNRPRGQGRANE